MRIALLLALILMLPCQKEAKSICYLKDRFFIQQAMDIQLNPQDYSDKIINIEGLFEKYVDENKIERYIVYRKTAGCCGDDGSVGFEFLYKKGKLDIKPGEWILVEGHVLEKADKEGNNLIYLDAISVTKKKKGTEFVK